MLLVGGVIFITISPSYLFFQMGSILIACTSFFLIGAWYVRKGFKKQLFDRVETKAISIIACKQKSKDEPVDLDSIYQELPGIIKLDIKKGDLRDIFFDSSKISMSGYNKYEIESYEIEDEADADYLGRRQ